jgi:hypothetical protein
MLYVLTRDSETEHKIYEVNIWKDFAIILPGFSFLFDLFKSSRDGEVSMSRTFMNLSCPRSGSSHPTGDGSVLS